MLDYDGTLVPLAPRPEEARPSPRLLKLLSCLSQDLKRHVAVVSGRRVEELADLLPLPYLFLAGLHGREVLHPAQDSRGSRLRLKLGPPGPPPGVWEEIQAHAERLATQVSGCWVEDKKEAIALHFREADPKKAAQIVATFIRFTQPLVEAHQLEYLKGNKVIEVRIKGIHKGIAVEYFLKLFPHAFPIFLGDDLTDEDAFRMLKGRGLSVLVGEPRPTLATYNLPTPAKVEDFLERLIRG
ncbi:trehalose-phosphatase [Thermanaeromonas toyohensis]|uniref:trehalose-phosphatase n=1 Tax=Thermanaeromonas toyohensis TaxID=161154 RepID=UPI001561670E|nr:trehalose-phosphatase [Thermanaeromonas toyohensis]